MPRKFTRQLLNLWKLEISMVNTLTPQKLETTTEQLTLLSLPSHLLTIASTHGKCFFSLFLIPWLSLFPVLHCEELMVYQEKKSSERRTWSPRKISTLRFSQLTHPLSPCCVFRLHSATCSVNTSYVEKYLVFTRRNQGFP